MWKGIKLGLGVAVGLLLAKAIRWILLAIVVAYTMHSLTPSQTHETAKPAPVAAKK